ncbi:MAG: hypothetical protein K2O65_05160 [Lachnospiraceae bacterium]|nr:hypothetical protein [Lachnospiraceae bacterium]
MHASISENYEKFLDFENSGKVLSFHYQYRNMLVWPFIRNVMWNCIYKTLFGENAGLIDTSAQNLKKGRLFGYKWLQFFKFNKNPLFACKQTDILYLYHVIGNVKDENDVYYNRIYDDFVALHDSTAIIESAPLFRHFYPKKYKTYEADSIEIICAFHEKIASLNEKDKNTIEQMIDYLKRDFPFALQESHWRIIRIELERYAKNMKLIYEYYHKVFTRISPKLVFVAQACDGSHMACKIKVLRDMGIPSAEIQHGLISNEHFAYNYSRAVCDSEEYRSYLPDHFLTFGHFWEKTIRLPVHTEVLGSANFSRNFDKTRKSDNDVGNETQDRNILILPSVLETYMELVRYLYDKLPDRRLIIKVHPTKIKQYEVFKTMENDRISVYIKENINNFFDRAAIVIGDDSTALYEAAALGKQVMIWDTEYSRNMHRAIGRWFADKEELLSILQSDHISMIAETKPEDIFARDSKRRYRAFIAGYVSE